MSPRLGIALLLVALAVAGCGGEGPSRADGSARLWVTRDRGSVVMLDARVPAGQTLLRALRSKLPVKTRYGGAFVQEIDGISGSLLHRRDWFWLVNGLVGDRSAVSYRLRDGDVAWWDYRGWERDAETLEVVVGAFPEPFRHGYDGRVRAAAVRYAPGLGSAARRVAKAIGAVDVAPAAAAVPKGANLFELVGGAPRFRAALRTPGSGPSAPVRFTFAGDVDALLGGAFRRRFAVP
ncbi:hypothetical protein Gocc_2846 [Gaiella occulta]|uniref:Transcobalamin-like C-terminal domain-containing protein n=1 Tax=Gaiella occulta TaxID=1002870 RepID=A0A7M2YUS3_9ACTN|nr:DUF4430 domain-containing protein [Gaiella occulta]RDI73490.1 hypothetical protein Gocc_2846 [Gaiella occulta]